LSRNDYGSNLSDALTKHFSSESFID